METASIHTPLPRSLPEQQDLSSGSILRFLDELSENSIEVHSFMLLRHGHVIAEGWWSPYKPHAPHNLFSLTKSFTSTAIGLAEHEGLLSIDDSVLSFFPDKTPAEPDERLLRLTLRHLLTMSTGHSEDPVNHFNEQESWTDTFLKASFEHEPGTTFMYNNAASYMLSAILQKVSGMTLLEYLQPRLFEPLGIHEAEWETCPEGICVGGRGLFLTTASIAKFGLLYLQKGVWNGQQIVPEQWILQASSLQIANGDPNEPNDWKQGYGFQFWRCRHNAYRADGAFGQFCLIMPGQDAVLAVTSGTDRMHAVLDAVWNHLLPGMEAGSASSSDESSEAADELRSRLSSLSIEAPRLLFDSPLEAKLSLTPYVFDANPFGLGEVTIEFQGHSAILNIDRDGQQAEVSLGRGTWIPGSLPFLHAYGPLAFSFTWSGTDLLELAIRTLQGPICLFLTVRVENNGLTVSARSNVGEFSLPSPLTARVKAE
ncbi:serine hydrolase domain-containing protein [Paenibacillus sp. CN-4]|uniref:serine hydrolase domain-containing protein n=1 Tax=Paenibacillus nanchangensis TaxID=3348343 RepID=UPI00397960B1